MSAISIIGLVGSIIAYTVFIFFIGKKNQKSASYKEKVGLLDKHAKQLKDYIKKIDEISDENKIYRERINKMFNNGAKLSDVVSVLDDSSRKDIAPSSD